MNYLDLKVPAFSQIFTSVIYHIYVFEETVRQYKVNSFEFCFFLPVLSAHFISK